MYEKLYDEHQWVHGNRQNCLKMFSSTQDCCLSLHVWKLTIKTIFCAAT